MRDIRREKCVFLRLKSLHKLWGFEKKRALQQQSSAKLQEIRRFPQVPLHVARDISIPRQPFHFISLILWSFPAKQRGEKGEGEEREAVLWVAKRWHTMYGGERAVMSVAAAVVSVFNLEPGERLCFLCWDSSASRIQEEEGGSRSKVDERVSCLCSCCSTSYPVAAFCTKMRPRIYSCDILSKSPPSHFVCRTCGVTVQSENAARNNGYSDDLCFLTSPRENKCPN